MSYFAHARHIQVQAPAYVGHNARGLFDILRPTPGGNLAIQRVCDHRVGYVVDEEVTVSRLVLPANSEAAVCEMSGQCAVIANEEVRVILRAICCEFGGRSLRSRRRDSEASDKDRGEKADCDFSRTFRE